MKCISLTNHLSFPNINTFSQFVDIMEDLKYIYTPMKDDFGNKLYFSHISTESIFLIEYHDNSIEKNGYAKVTFRFLDNRYSNFSIYQLPHLMFNNYVYEYKRILSSISTIDIEAGELLFLNNTTQLDMKHLYRQFLESKGFKYKTMNGKDAPFDFLSPNQDKMGNIFVVKYDEALNKSEKGFHMVNTLLLISDDQIFNPSIFSKYSERFIKLISTMK